MDDVKTFCCQNPDCPDHGKRVVPGERTEEKVHQRVPDFKKRTEGQVPHLLTSDEYPAYKMAIIEAHVVVQEQPRTGRPGRGGRRLVISSAAKMCSVCCEPSPTPWGRYVSSSPWRLCSASIADGCGSKPATVKSPGQHGLVWRIAVDRIGGAIHNCGQPGGLQYLGQGVCRSNLGR